MSKKATIGVLVLVAILAGLFLVLRPEANLLETNQQAKQQTTLKAPTGPKTFNYKIMNDTTKGPATIEVTKGEQIVIKVQSEVEEKLHLHGYDLSASVSPSKTTELSFTAGTAGQFELETHNSGLKVTTLLVRP